MSNPNDIDLAALHPAEFERWRDRAWVTCRQAVFLSLGVDPDAIDEVVALDAIGEAAARNAVSCDVMGLAPDEVCFSPHYGQQHADYLRRTEAIGYACSNASLSCERRGSLDYLGLSAFVTWANDRKWDLPVELVALAKLQGNMGRGDTASREQARGPRDETLERRMLLKGMVEEQLRIRPNLSKSKLATAVECQLNQPDSQWTLSWSSIRNILFYSDDPLFSDEQWRSAKTQAHVARRQADQRQN